MSARINPDAALPSDQFTGRTYLLRLHERAYYIPVGSTVQEGSLYLQGKLLSGESVTSSDTAVGG